MAYKAAISRSLTLVLLISFASNSLAFSSTASTFTSTTSRTLPLELSNVRSIVRHPLQTERKNKSTRLEMSLAPAVSSTVGSVGAIAGAISGGVLGGALHAIAGPDHLAALLPKCCGQRWFRAGRIGALWGMGHGVSATVLGLAAFSLKSRISNLSFFNSFLSNASHITEFAIGASLILIGALGIKEAMEWSDDIKNGPQHSLSAAVADPELANIPSQKRAIVFNGILHGLSWDGAPSLAPALAVATWRGSISFLLSYAVGTMIAMSGATIIIGEGTRRAGEFFDRPDIPQKMSLISSFLALGVGVIWSVLALK